MDTAEGERLRRWRLVLGEEAQASCGLAGLSPEDRQMDEALAALYEADSRHSLRGGSGASSPRVARWLGDIRRFFPSSVVQVMQKDAFERLNLHSMLLQPEMLESVQPDVNLVSTLMSLRGIIPEKTKETARLVVRKVVDALMKQLEEPMRTAVSGALNRAVHNRRPRHAEIDWNRTIRANLKHWQQEYKTIVPETLIGYGRKSQRVQREIILCIDQSGSMASSVVYSSIFGAVMASMPAVKTHLVVFDTAVVDMTEQLDDPVDLLFGVQLGGGTDINRAVGYCQSLIRDPRNTILVLISDLYEGGVEKNLLQRANELVQSGVQVITLLALSNEGTPFYDKALAAKLAGLGIPSFACTPDLFPGMMAADDYDLAGFTVGVVDKPKVIDSSRMAEGDVVLALPSSGFHSNGYSLVRKVFDVENADLGRYDDELGETLGEALLRPTVIYVKPVLRCIEAADVKGVSHITGGGFYENVPRCIPDGLCARIDKAAIKTPAIFRLLQKKGGIDEHDMFNTFNMGVGMAVIVSPETADAALSALKAEGIDAYVCGEIVAGEEKVVLC